MAYKTITVENTANISNGMGVAIVGKNGFNTILGSIPILCNAIAKVDATGDKSIKDGNVRFTVEGLSSLIDLNFNKNVLLVNDDPAVFGGLKGIDYVGIPINEKTDTGADIGHVGYNPIVAQISLPIESFDLANNTLKVNNSVSANHPETFLLDSLPPTPFYLKISQLLDQTYFANNSVYVEGLKQTFTKTFNTTSTAVGGYSNVNINIVPRYKTAISVYIDNEEQQQSIFTWDNKSNVNVQVGTGKVLTIRTDHYTVPVIEPGDNISLFSGNVYAISETSYNPTSPSYNAALTANSLYRVKFASALTANISGSTGVNITSDIQGMVGNLNSTTKTFTIDYDETVYPGGYGLASYKVYDISLTRDFESLELTKEGKLKNVPTGSYVVRARNTNTFNRKSPYSTKRITIASIPIGKVTDLSVSESLYRDKQVGVAVRATISFTPIVNQSVTEYEVSYKLVNNLTSVDLVTYTTVKVPASGVAEDGKIYFKLDNIERGGAASTYKLYVRVTPLNNDMRGITTETSADIVGKTAKPSGVTRFSASQLGDQILFSWAVPRDSNGDPLEIDLYQFTIKQLAGTYTSATEANWESAVEIGSAFANVSFLNAPVREYGTYTYLIRTKDTTGNQCEASGIAVFNITTIRPPNLQTFRAYSEDSPSTNDYISGSTNNNYFEYYYPSFANSAYGGIAGAGRHTVDNSNGTSTGFSVASGITDLTATANAVYITQIRDLGQVITARLTSSVNLVQVVSTAYNDFKENVYIGVSDANLVGMPSTFRDLDSGINFNGLFTYAEYDYNNKTLTSGGPTGNVYAIWNYGQFTNDVSNANSYALIYQVLDSFGILQLGNTYFANGVATGSNTLANLTKGISYAIVNLNQYSDKSTVTYSGPAGALTFNVDVRYSSASNVYYSGNNQVNTKAFVGYATNDGWSPLSESDITLRHFQLRLSITNNKPGQVSSILDKFRYAVNLTRKTFSTSNTVNSSNTRIDYSTAGFSIIPTINITQTSGINPVVPVINYKDTNNCYISLYYSANGASVTGVSVDIQANGA